MSNEENPSEKKPRRTAKPDVGAKYEISVAVLVAASLSINKQVEDYRIFTNVQEALPFDDVVAKVLFKGESAPYAYAIQLKHMGKGETLDVGKYLKGYSKILKDGGFKTVGKIAVDNIHFCYFCIRGVRTVDYTLNKHNPTTGSWRSALSFQNCHKLSHNNPTNQLDNDFLDKFYLYFNQPDSANIKENIKNVCKINDATDILKYVDRFFEKDALWVRGLCKEVFESELLKIHLSDYIVPPTDIIQLNNSQTAIWNKLTLQHNVTIVKAEDNIEKTLYGCLAQMLNHLLNDVVDWRKCKTNILGKRVTDEFMKFVPGKVRHWIDKPTTLKSLIIELWKCRKLPLILKGEDELSILTDYAHLNKSFIIVTDKLVSRREEFDRYHLRVFTHVKDIEYLEVRGEIEALLLVALNKGNPHMVELLLDYHACVNGADKYDTFVFTHDAANANMVKLLLNKATILDDQDQYDNSTLLKAGGMSENLKDELLKTISISLHGRKPITLSSIAKQHKELTATLSCSHILHLMRSRKEYLSKECVEGDHNMIFLIEDPTSSAKYNIDNLNKIGDNITIRCPSHEIIEYRKRIETNPKLRNYTIYYCITSSENEDFTLIEGNKALLGDFFVDQHGESVHVLENIPVPVIGASLKYIQNSYIPRYLRTAVLSKTLFDSPIKGICFFSGDLSYLDVDIRKCVGEISLDTINEKQQSQNENLFIHIKSEDADKYWEQALNLKCPLLHIRVEGTDMELCKCRNWKGLSDHITYTGRRISEEALLTEITDGITVLTGEPGMGKSSLLRSLFKNHATGKYVLFYNLVDYGRYLGQHNLVPDNISIDFIFKQFKSSKYNEFLTSLYETKQNVLLLLDAFDEVLPFYKEKVLNFIRNLAKSNVQIIIATRLIADHLLIDSFGTRTFKVDILGEDDRHVYIKSWKLGEQELNGVPREFLESPLYLNFLKIICDSHMSLTNINKLTLYEKVLKIKLDQYFERNYTADESDKEYLLKPVLELHGKLALLVTLGEHVVSKFLDWNRERELSNKLKLGIIEFIDEDGYPTFVHKTFAEYLTIDWLIRNIREDVAKNIYLEMLKRDNLLEILYEDLELHKAVIQGNIQDVKLFAKNASNLSAVDRLGRTALHAATICYEMNAEGETFYDDKFFKIVNIIIKQMRKNQCDFMQSSLLIQWDWQYHFQPGNLISMSNKLILEIYINTVKRKLEKGDKVETSFWFQEFNHIFLTAVKARSISIIRDLLFIKNYRINSKFNNLYRACLYCDNILKKIKSNTKVSSGLTPLHIACIYGNVCVAKKFLNLRSDANAIDEFNCTPLYYSIINTHEVSVDMTKLLLEAGANVNYKNWPEETPLSIVVRTGKLNVAKVLLEHGGNVNENIEAALRIAVNENNFDMVQLLLEYIDNIEKYGTTVLAHAAANGRVDMVELLLNKGAVVNDQGQSGSSALLEAAHKPENLRTVKLLLENGANVDSTSTNGETPLFNAARRGNADMVKLLLETNANPNCATNTFRESPLFINCGHLNSGTSKLLLAYGANVDSATINGETPIFDAAARDHEENVKLFLEYKANVNCTTTDGKTPLFIAATRDSLNIVKLLLNNGALVNRATQNGESPLFIASACGNLRIMKQLLESEGNVNQANRTGETPLFIASTRNNLDAVKLLLTYDANVNNADVDGRTPIFMASAGNQLDIVELLLEWKANVNSATKNRQTPIFIASKRGLLNMVKLLLQNGANLNDINENSQLLCIAASEGNLDFAKILIEKGVEVNKARWFGMSALSYAVKYECLDTVKLLIDAGANVNRVDKAGLTALSHAAEVNNAHIVKLLLNSNANVNKGWPLYFAATKKDLTVAKLLLAKGADVNIKVPTTGETPLFNAARHWNLNMVKLSLEHNVDVNIMNRYGGTVLFNVLSECPYGNHELRLDIIILLLDNNANVNEEYLDAAVKIGYRPIVKLLSKKICKLQDA